MLITRLVAGALGAKEVTLTDKMLFMSRYNLGRNFRARPELEKRFRLQALKWGDAEQIAEAGPPFDLIIGTDIMYITEYFMPLAESVIFPDSGAECLDVLMELFRRTVSRLG